MRANPEQIREDRIELKTLSTMNRTSFVARLGHVFERSSWIAEQSWEKRPFASLDDLHRAMVEVMRGAGRERQLALIRAHPELGAAAFCPDSLTASSQEEQSSVGLTERASEDVTRLHALNASYRKRFGFPFVMAIRGRRRAEILSALEERLANGPEIEFERALSEIARIAYLRLQATLEA